MTCSHHYQDKEVREINMLVGDVEVAPYYDKNTPDTELAGTRPQM